MAKKKAQDENEVLLDVGQTFTKAERFFEENKSVLLGGVIGLFVLVGAYFGYTKLYAEPLELEAQEALFKAQTSFQQDSLDLALNGRGEQMGLIAIADEYGSTKAGNLANYYAGVAYLNQANYAEAIDYLDAFSSNDPVLSVIAKGGIADAFWELGQPKEALEYYDRAVSGKDNQFVVPVYLYRAAMVAEELKQYDDAIDYVTRLQEEFPDAPESLNAKKQMARLEALKAQS